MYMYIYVCHSLPSGRLNPMNRGAVFVVFLLVFYVLFSSFFLLIISFIIFAMSSSLLFFRISWSVPPLIFSFRSRYFWHLNKFSVFSSTLHILHSLFLYLFFLNWLLHLSSLLSSYILLWLLHNVSFL